jgi:hypothetical protein
VNNVLFPVLGMQGSIVESTAKLWLRFRLGYQCKEAKHGIYIDGHECPDMNSRLYAFNDLTQI